MHRPRTMGERAVQWLVSSEVDPFPCGGVDPGVRRSTKSERAHEPRRVHLVIAGGSPAKLRTQGDVDDLGSSEGEIVVEIQRDRLGMATATEGDLGGGQADVDDRLHSVERTQRGLGARARNHRRPG